MLSGCLDRLPIKLRYAVDGVGNENNFLYLHRNFTLLTPSAKVLPIRNCCIQIRNNPNTVIVSFKRLLLLTKNCRKSTPKVIKQPLLGYPQLLIYSPLPPYLRFVSYIRNMRMSHALVSKEPLDRKGRTAETDK